MTTSRRQFLAASAVVPAGAVIAPIEHLLASGRTDEAQAERWAALQSIFGQQHPDAELLAAYEEANRLRDWMDGPESGDDDVPDHIGQRYGELVKLIAALPASTAAGVVAKLSTFTHEIQGNAYSYKGPDEDEGLFPKFIRTAIEGAQKIAQMHTKV
ncbi:twin-arginine translocation signal domain-containing protein [Azospirillum sp. TSA2s]|uniref:twin-arginine translocation signal domain-containing protein n=1 Tax=Azospirillum sp. TSA2s TaxID=709810 RepID=UPI0010AAE842|nr:twin-arginine translocation signal domain-containing protein [Azospirillum sp. TSA2s]QCG93966.1 twin-arginine translocation signal domain-containing protein [Azospirillum sp. TSA2s]